MPGPVDPYRVFVSYSRSDKRIVKRLVKTLERAGMIPMWDEDLPPGVRFTEQIQSFIANSHVFLPVFTRTSIKRAWLHQEIGFAAALAKPILPVTLGDLADPPSGFIAEIHKIQLRADLRDAREKLSLEAIHDTVGRWKHRPATYECTEDNARRALLLAGWAESITDIGRHGTVRQLASLTSFHLPDRPESDPVWKAYFPGEANNYFLFENLRKELNALRRHARERGCQLIIDPAELLPETYRKHGPESVRARINGFLEFLKDGSIRDVAVAINNDPKRESSITLVGDWFSSEAVSSGRERVLREALFTRSAHVVRQQMEDFDRRMRELLSARRWRAEDSRAKAAEYLEQYLGKLS
jgi:hypothetical protein